MLNSVSVMLLTGHCLCLFSSLRQEPAGDLTGSLLRQEIIHVRNTRGYKVGARYTKSNFVSNLLHKQVTLCIQLVTLRYTQVSGSDIGTVVSVELQVQSILSNPSHLRTFVSICLAQLY
eukprot:SAG31_NODE_1129_length_9755_cov_2.095070_2_plen_119_part_00